MSTDMLRRLTNRRFIIIIIIIPLPSLFPLPLPSPSRFPLPSSFSFPFPLTQVDGLWSTVSSPGLSGRSPATKRIFGTLRGKNEAFRGTD